MLNLDPFISTVFLLFLISSHCEDDEVWKLIKRRAGPGCKDEILGLKFCGWIAVRGLGVDVNWWTADNVYRSGI